MPWICKDGNSCESLLYSMYFQSASGVDKDARQCLAAARSKILANVQIVFSRVFPQAMSNPETHSLWKMAQKVKIWTLT